MFDLGSVIATIKADTSNFKEGIEKSQGLLGGFGSTLGKIGSGLKTFGIVAGAAAGIAAVGIGITAAAAGEAEKEMLKFEGLMSQTFGKVPKDFREAREAALELSKSFVQLGFDDEETAVAMAKSLAVTKDVTESKKEMALAADFARLQDIGIGDAQKILQMAYMGNARVLKQYGIELSDNATKTEIFGKIQQIAGGQADAFANSYSGAMAKFNIEFGNLKEKIGEVFLPILSEAFSQISDFIGNLNSADFSWFSSAIESILPVIENLYTTVSTTVTNIITWFNTYLMPFIVMLVDFIKLHWDTIVLYTQVLGDILTSIFTIVTTIVTAIVQTFLAGLLQFWKENGENIIKGLQGTWNLIVGMFQTVTGILSIILAIFLGIITGKWDEAWSKILRASVLVWDGIKNILNGAVKFITGWGATILHELVKPFQDAWNRISEFVNKIKESLDFTKRHSPSVVDIVRKGVGEVNRAMQGLTFGDIVPEAAALSVSSAGASTRINNVTINMDGAMIGDGYSARQIGETIGDSIIQKLKLNIRF